MHDTTCPDKMLDLIRDAPLGVVIRFATGNRVLKYPEEEPGFRCPNCYQNGDAPTKEGSQKSSSPPTDEEKQDIEKAGTTPIPSPGNEFPPMVEEAIEPLRDVEKASSTDSEPPTDFQRVKSASSALTRTRTLPYTQERLREEEAMAIERRESIPIAATKTADGTILVDWYTTDDQENPQVGFPDVGGPWH